MLNETIGFLFTTVGNFGSNIQRTGEFTGQAAGIDPIIPTLVIIFIMAMMFKAKMGAITMLVLIMAVLYILSMGII